MKKLIIICAVPIILASCVSNRTFNSLKAENMRLQSEVASAGSRIEELSVRSTRLSEQGQDLREQLERLQEEHSGLRERYNSLLAQGSQQSELMLLQLEENQRKMEELQNMLDAREQALGELRRKVADALLGFEGKGLTVTTRDGKVYVSMDDKLLFRSGSFEIDPQGAQAVRDLAVVLAQNADITIMVEGHTDDVPYKGSGQLRDNLDLSVKRATTVVRLLLENEGIDPVRVVASGRGEYLPVDSAQTSDARARNRRTEIILSPKLDELLNILDR